MAIISSLSVASAQAAIGSTTPGGLCTKSGSITVISGKTYTCIKALSGKLIWAASATPPTIGGAKPQIGGGLGGEEDAGNPGGDQGSRTNPRQIGLTKYNTCLVAHGGTALVSPSRVRGIHPTPGTPVVTIAPKLNTAQIKAITDCASLAPKPQLKGDD